MELHGIVVGESDFLQLDSSTPHKFSRHVILHLPNGHLFPNAECVGCFMRLGCLFGTSARVCPLVIYLFC